MELDYYCPECLRSEVNQKLKDVQTIMKSYVGYISHIKIGFCPVHGVVEGSLSLKAKKT